MNFKLNIMEISIICLIGIIVNIIVFFYNLFPVIGLGFGIVIILRYTFIKLEAKGEMK